MVVVFDCVMQDASEAFESPRSYYSAEGSDEFHSVHSQSFKSETGAQESALA